MSTVMAPFATMTESVSAFTRLRLYLVTLPLHHPSGTREDASADRITASRLGTVAITAKRRKQAAARAMAAAEEEDGV